MRQDIAIDGRMVPMQASGATPVFYRQKFHKDMLIEIAPFMQGKQIEDFSVYENIAYIMAKRADPENVPDDPVEWLDSFDSPTAIYDALPDIMTLWLNSNKTTSVSKKESAPQSEE